MQAHFSIAVEPDIDLVSIIMGGFFSENDVASFAYALKTKMQILRCAPNAHVTLCDASAMNIQTQEIVSAFTSVVANPLFRSRRLAFITGSSLARMQTRRLTDREGVAFFSDPQEARSWLFA